MSCNKCNRLDCCGGCGAAPYGCMFSIQANPYDASYWNVTINGCTTQVKIPKISETCTSLTTDYSNATLNYKGECGTNTITGRQIGQLINLDDLRDVEAKLPAPCSMLVWNPGCNTCNDDCQPIGEAWRPYTIPDAGNCVMDLDDDGYYHVLKKTDCGCIKECKLPAIPSGMTTIDFARDSVPDDPDFPWYYGIYNDKINLHLADNFSAYFGKYALKVTVNYGVQVIHSDYCPNVNWRSLVVPVIDGESIRVTQCASILQNWAMAALNTSAGIDIPWGSCSLRGSITFVVPKGKEAYLHHEFRLRTNASFPKYLTCPKDGQRVPDEEAKLDSVLYTASRLNALQIIIEPTQGAANYSPVVDDERSQLDNPTDEYPPIAG